VLTVACLSAIIVSFVVEDFEVAVTRSARLMKLISIRQTGVHVTSLTPCQAPVRHQYGTSGAWIHDLLGSSVVCSLLL
jgi:hypothetical protein